MFNKLKQFKDLRKQAKSIQGQLAQETITVDKNGVVIVMDGNLELTKIKINEELPKDKLEKIILDNTNVAIKKTQRIMTQKMQEMGGLPGF